MKKISFALSGLSLLACAATATAADESKFPVCISFAPAGFCDGMEFDTKSSATWHNTDCNGAQIPQTTAKYKKTRANTTCVESCGCSSLEWNFNLTASTGTEACVIDGHKQILLDDVPVGISKGACDFSPSKGGVSSLAR